MDIGSMMTGYLGAEGGTSLVATTAAQKLYALDTERGGGRDLGEGAGLGWAQMDSLLATVFWQIFLESPSYRRLLEKAGVAPQAIAQSERFVVSHGDESAPRYDLVILTPAPAGTQPRAIGVPGDLVIPAEDWERWKQRIQGVRGGHDQPLDRPGAPPAYAQFLEFAANIDADFLRESLELKPFGIVVIPAPATELTAIPIPAWGVSCSPGARPTSTAGVIATNDRGECGVTVALHALARSPADVVPGVTQVMVQDRPGTVRSVDPITDSAFVDLGPCTAISVQPVKPLTGVSPRAHEQVTFEGLVSRRRTAVVTGWSPDLPLVLPFNQLKVLTTAVTEPGDSGAALVDNENHVIGFAFYRTGLGQDTEFSAWIWADSVYRAHRLT
jgi:hypothetical protein